MALRLRLVIRLLRAEGSDGYGHAWHERGHC